MIYVMCTLDKFIFTYDFCYCEKRTITKVSLLYIAQGTLNSNTVLSMTDHFTSLLQYLQKRKKQNNYKYNQHYIMNIEDKLTNIILV